MKTLQLSETSAPREPNDMAKWPAPPAKRTTENRTFSMEVLPPLIGALVGVAILIGFGIALAGQAGGLAALGAALLGSQSAWYLSRASAFAAYVLLWWSMVLGLSMTNRLARIWPGGPVAGELHEQASLLGVGLAVLHALVLLADSYIGYTLPQILIPFSTSYLPVWVGLGQLGLYLMLLVTLSFYVRRWIGTRTWRALHYLSFVVFVMALLHGLFSGTDSSALWAIVMYAGTGLSVIALTIYRIIAQRGSKQPAAHQTPAQLV